MRRLLLRLAVLLAVSGVLLLVLAAIIWFDNGFNRGIVYQPAPEPIPLTAGPQVGVNLYQLHLEPDPAVVTQTLQMVQAMGARYVRMQLPWEDIEIHGPGDFEDRRNIDTIGIVSAWDKYDRIVNKADELGIELILRIDRPPLWAREGFHNESFFQEGLLEDPNSTGPPDNFADYGRFVSRVVERYEGKVRYFQIWNEPNLKNEWNWHTPRPESFVDLLEVGYHAAKAANPDAIILFPSLAPVDGLDKRAPMTELDYLDAVYRAGGAAFFDVMAVQAYGLGQPPDEHRYIRLLPYGSTWTWNRFIDARADVSRVVLVREVMERYNDHATPIWVGEFGWNSAPDSIPPERRYTWGEPVSEEQKAAYLIGHIERARDEWPWMGVMNVWMFRYGGFREPNPADPTQYFALVGRDWQPLPAYTYLQAYHAQPTVAGVGAHPWQHPAVETIPNGWRIRFVGEQLHLLGDIPGDIRVVLDSTESTLLRGEYHGQYALSTVRLPRSDTVHTLELTVDDATTPPPPPVFVVERTPPVPLWVWTVLPMLAVGLLLLSGAATVPPLFQLASLLIARTPPARMGLRPWLATPGGERFLLFGLFVGLFFFYKGGTDLPSNLLALAVFGLFALVRPDLALLYVPLTVPLFFIPKGIWDTRFGLPEQGLRLPLHEMLLLITALATGPRWAWHVVQWVRQHGLRVPLGTLHLVRSLLPHGLFLVVGTLAVVIAPAEGRSEALREWRWLIFEPLLFYVLLRYYLHVSRQQHSPPSLLAPRLTASAVLGWLVAGGALVGLIGLLQFGGLNLAPFLGDKVSFSADSIVVEGVQRVNSVYGHPNNLGLYMGRIWPIALVLALAAWLAHRRWVAGAWAACAVLAAGGLLVSFSKGALLAAPVALLVLVLALRSHFRHHPTMSTPWAALRARVPTRLLGFAVGLAVVALPLLVIALATAAGGIERLNPLGETTDIRLKLWASALAMIADHPIFGIGLDQFLRFYQQYIDPTLATTNERFTAHPHNLLLDIWLRLGLGGLLAFGWLLLRFARQLQAYLAQNILLAGLVAALTAALVHGLVDNFYFVPDLAFVFWLVVALSEEGAEAS
ncbi:MAG: cellulase family glycosylhydrolase [Chloroflexaceae bacterium]|nr:cellulase family glycosylhydrolase [Chloroflexaceae bacterium]